MGVATWHAQGANGAPMLPRQQPEVQFAQQLRLKDRYGGRAVQESDKRQAASATSASDARVRGGSLQQWNRVFPVEQGRVFGSRPTSGSKFLHDWFLPAL